jgi:predicted Zn-dependent peptidase
MKTTSIFFLIITLSIAGTSSASAETALQLENGLDVILMSNPNADDVGLVMLYRIGEQHDPPGQSGLCHLIEHLYFTCEAGHMPARTHDKVTGRFRKRVRTQIGREYSAFSVVFNSRLLKLEIKNAAARMGKLKITDSDLIRETARVQEALVSMHAKDATLSALQISAAAAAPLGEGSRRGGTMQSIRSIPAGSVTKWYRAHYKASNAILVISGVFDENQALEWIREDFKEVKKGKKPRDKKELGEPRLGKIETGHLPASGNRGGWGAAAIAFAAPMPGNQNYPAFLMIAAEMNKRNQQVINKKRNRKPPFKYGALTEPELCWFNAPLEHRQEGGDAIADLRETVRKAIKARVSPKSLNTTLDLFGTDLGLIEPLPIEARGYAEGLALGAARRKQLGLNPTRLYSALEKVTNEDITRCASEIFGEKAGAAAVVLPPK